MSETPSLKIPAPTMLALIRYKNQHLPTEGFLEAVLSNDLVGVFMRGDERNLAALGDIVRWVYHELPDDSWGSILLYDKWTQQARPVTEPPVVTPAEREDLLSIEEDMLNGRR